MTSPAMTPPSTALPRLTSRGQLLLWLICLLGLGLRLWLQKDRAFEGDELGSLRFIEESYAHLLSTFRDQLTMNYYLVVLKALAESLGSSPWILVLPSVAAGVAVSYLTARLVLHVADERLALASAFLIATNPCLILFSIRIRSYMLLVALSIGAILCYYNWARERSWRHGIACAGWSLAALLMHPNALYQMSFIIVMLATELWRRRERAMSFLVPMGLAALVTAAAYLPIREDMAIFRERWTTGFPSEWGYLPDSMRLFFVGQAWMLPSLALFGIGLWVASQESRPLAKLGLAILVPMIMTSFMGVSHYPWTYARFLMPVLPVMLVFIARGLTQLAPRSKPLFAILVLGLCFTWWPRLDKALRERRELPYVELAEHIQSLELPDGSLYAFNPVVRGRLLPYLPKELFTTLGSFYKASVEGESGWLMVITEKQALTTEVQGRSFGRLRLYPFRGKTKRAAVGLLFKDTVNTFADRPIAPPRVAVYYKELVLMAQLFQSPTELEYTRLYYITERYDKKHRQMPDQLRSPAMLNRQAP